MPEQAEPPRITAPENLDLEAFPPHLPDDWRRVVEQGPQGVSVGSLSTSTVEGLLQRPLYGRADVADLFHLGSRPGESPHVRGGGRWEIRSEPLAPHPSGWNELAHEDLAGGVDALTLRLDRAVRSGLDPEAAGAAGKVGMDGVSVATRTDLSRALEGVDLIRTPVTIECGSSATALAALFFADQPSAERFAGGLLADPLGELLSEGALPVSLEQLYDELADLVAFVGRRAPAQRVVVVHADALHDGGAHAVQEVAFAIATGADYLRALVQRGLSADEVSQRMVFSFSVGTRFFLEVAKLRAARLLWDGVARAFGCGPAASRLVAQVRTSTWTASHLDPWVNMVRGSVQAFAAAVGGADSLVVRPFDAALGHGDPLSRRQARNTQIVCQQEAHLGRVMDPGGGSWFLESFTDALARAGWELFQQVESRGGMAAAILDGFPQREVAACADRRAARLARGEDIMVGASRYPDLAEELVLRPASGSAAPQRVAEVGPGPGAVGGPALEQLGRAAAGEAGGRWTAAAVEAARAGASQGEILRALRAGRGEGPVAEVLRRRRAAESFEALRSAAAAHRARTGHHPRAALLPCGTSEKLHRKIELARGQLALGGFEVVIKPRASSPAEAARGAATVQEPVLVLCAEEADYPALVPVVAGSGGPALAVVARPSSSQWASQVQAFIYQGCDQVELLSRLQRAVAGEVLQ